MTSRRLRPEEARLWAQVARTVSAAPGMRLQETETEAIEFKTERELSPSFRAPAKGPSGPIYTRRSPRADLPSPAPTPRLPSTDPDAIEPNRKRRIVRAPDAIAARLDLHGLDQDRARAALHAFILAAQAQGARAVLVITGKGRAGGEGVLRARTPQWLAESPVRAAVAGVSQADARHGGAGAYYVALKKRP